MARRLVDARTAVLDVLRAATEPLDDDQIAQLAGINRHYVNALCRNLEREGALRRTQGPAGKLVNALVTDRELWTPTLFEPRANSGRERRKRSPQRLNDDLEQLIGGFAGYVAAFEERQPFPGPSLYFHERAIERRRAHGSVRQMLQDWLFLDYVYAVLPAWGMHRMGPQAAKVAELAPIVEELHAMAAELERLWPLRITALDVDEVDGVAETAWALIERLRVSTSQTQIVAGSKFLHHLLPDLVPPIDRQYTFSFFTGQKAVYGGDRRTFLEWFPQLAAIGAQCRFEISDAIRRGGFMATGEAKVIDNAIMGFIQRQTGAPAVVDDRQAMPSDRPPLP